MLATVYLKRYQRTGSTWQVIALTSKRLLYCRVQDHFVGNSAALAVGRQEAQCFHGRHARLHACVQSIQRRTLQQGKKVLSEFSDLPLTGQGVIQMHHATLYMRGHACELEMQS